MQLLQATFDVGDATEFREPLSRYLYISFKGRRVIYALVYLYSFIWQSVYFLEKWWYVLNLFLNSIFTFYFYVQGCFACLNICALYWNRLYIQRQRAIYSRDVQKYPVLKLYIIVTTSSQKWTHSSIIYPDFHDSSNLYMNISIGNFPLCITADSETQTLHIYQYSSFFFFFLFLFPILYTDWSSHFPSLLYF